MGARCPKELLNYGFSKFSPALLQIHFRLVTLKRINGVFLLYHCIRISCIESVTQYIHGLLYVHVVWLGNKSPNIYLLLFFYYSDTTAYIPVYVCIAVLSMPLRSYKNEMG